MNNDSFLEQIHLRIARKRRVQTSLISFLSVILMMVVSHNSMLFLNDLKMQTQWEIQQFSDQEIYQWERYPDLTEQEKLEYLIDELDVYDFFTDFNDDIIEHIKMNGV